MIRNDGFKGCYRGYPLLLTAGVPKAYVRFGVNDYMKNWFGREGIFYKIAAGMTAGACEGFFVHVPVENFKIKLIHDKVSPVQKYKNMIDGIIKVAKS